MADIVELPSPFFVPPPPPESVAQWYEQNEPYITECLGNSFPGPHSSFKAIDLYITDIIINHLLREGRERRSSVTVVDLGSGGGGVTVHLTRALLRAFRGELSLSVTGVTITDRAVSESCAVAAAEEVSSNVKFVTGNYHSLDQSTFPDGSCDCVTLINSLCHATDVGLVLKEAYRVLRPGGIVVIKDFFVLSPTHMADLGVPEEEYSDHIRRHAENFCMGIFDGECLTAAIERCFRSCRFVPLGEDTFAGREFAACCFKDKDPKTREFSSFGKVVFKGFAPILQTLRQCPFDEGLWIGTKADP
jgi:ubiquinone/menaquinone biosynthesis C-methylase UbiE